MNPAQLRVLLHSHYMSDPLERSSTVRDAIALLLSEDLIKDREGVDPLTRNGYETTDRGRAYIKMLCDTPLPVLEWRDPRES